MSFKDFIHETQIISCIEGDFIEDAKRDKRLPSNIGSWKDLEDSNSRTDGASKTKSVA